LGALTATVAGAGVDARFVEDVLPPDGAAGVRETAFDEEAPALPAGPAGNISPSCAGAVWFFTGFFIAFAMEINYQSLRVLPAIGLIAWLGSSAPRSPELLKPVLAHSPSH
jgi:hypothetical protein